MRILKISGRNLASLADEFTVDFEQEPLASSGLFAISGPTGAGKSTLLDALCLALYDSTPRLLKTARNASLLPDVGDETVSAQDPRNLLRRGATEGHAEVDFIGNDGVRYRARWSVRRSRGKINGGLMKAGMSLHRLPELAALGGTKTEVALEIVQRVGLSFEQFTRAVLLAQNEFSAFLKTEENERGELLETLTGSAIYSQISKRAYERYKAEQLAMQQLTARLADHTPQGPEARAALEAETAAADAALAAIDQRQGALEQQLRWQREADKLRQNEAAAEAALAAARAQAEAAAARRRRLATLDALQPARPLLADSARLDAETAAAQAALAVGGAELERALAAQTQAAQALAAAAAQLQAAEQAQAAAAPLLDQAKALDASIAALAPGHRLTGEARDAARRDAALAAEALQASAAELASTRGAHQQGAHWLAAHRRFDNLARQWPRWDRLFAQAEQTAALELQLGAELESAQAKAVRAAGAASSASAALEASAHQLREAEAARQQAIAALAGFDAENLRAQRQALELRREQAASAEKTWSELASVRKRLQLAHAQAAQLTAAGAAARTALDEALAAAPGLGSAFEQADRSLKAAELACADSVEDLRATLADGEPCPVCGGAEHPYQHRNAQLHAMLASLAAEVARCRALMQENLSAQATRRAMLASSADQLASATRDVAALEQSAQRLAAAWDAHPLAAEAPEDSPRAADSPGGSIRAAWLSAQLEALRANSLELDTQEQAAQRASQTRDAAQRSCDTLAASHAQQRDAAAIATATLAQTHAAQAALADKRAQAASTLAALLDELQAAFTPAADDMFAPQPAASQTDWQADWRRDPRQFRAARAAEAREWTEQSTLHAQRATALIALDAGHGAAAIRAERAAHSATATQADYARIDADVGAKRQQRRALWDGRPVREVEQTLAGAINAAKSALDAQQAASQAAAQAETRAREALAHAGQRLDALRSASSAAVERIAAWLSNYAAQHTELEAVADAPALAALLAHDAAATAHERAALNALDAQAAAAATVLGERRAQHALHLQTAAPDGAPPADALVASLAALQAERKAAHDAATALRLQIAQDDVRRERAQAMMAEVERQQLVERRWGKLSELIGSSDGKKFRNYAQQFTLDVLLGYANSHLAQLAKRYRLERVISAAGPSLGLMVRDQDMGGEIRSVNSLSGGESFLVSLALALGLASLSSNRVRVESLFIDEGFGSLDSDTLRVAMDALDGLQAMGRKVGVISHVQEMTERIAARIVVQPSGGGSSSVTVQ